LKYVFKTCLFIAALGALSCEEFDPAPEVRLTLPEGGAFLPGNPLVLAFSEAVDPDTLRVQIWPDQRDIEGAFLSSAEPVVNTCTVDTSPCGDLTLEVSSDGESATLLLDEEGLGKSGPPYVLHVLPGLEDEAGNATGQDLYFDYQFRSDMFVNEDPVEFDDGVYILVGSVTQPLPAVLTLISDVKVLETGEFYLAGAEGDPISSDFPNNTRNPEELLVDEEDTGFTAYVTGFIQLREGKRLLETQPVNVEIPLGPLVVTLEDVRLFGEIVEGPEGFDRIEGTLSFTKVVLTNTSSGASTEYDGDATAVTADYVPPELAPAGHPVICEDLCGVVTGTCEPPEEYPRTDFCDEWAQENQ